MAPQTPCESVRVYEIGVEHVAPEHLQESIEANIVLLTLNPDSSLLPSTWPSMPQEFHTESIHFEGGPMQDEEQTVQNKSKLIMTLGLDEIRAFAFC